MRITETCGCGASLDVTDGYHPDVFRAVNDWRRDHKHDSRALRATESDERGQVQPEETPDRDPRSTTASESERADEFGFGLGGAVIA